MVEGTNGRVVFWNGGWGFTLPHVVGIRGGFHVRFRKVRKVIEVLDVKRLRFVCGSLFDAWGAFGTSTINNVAY